MCGITGFFDPSRSSGTHAMQLTAARMGESLRHRGPDSGDQWIDADQGVALAHRRLAVIDLTPAGAQPMTSVNGRYIIVYNGEIYNFAALAEALRGAGHDAPGQNDTSVLLAAISAWGLAAALARLNGIFAFALWDKQERTMVLARDRLGVKPLYWGQVGVKYLFGSELRALLEHPDCPRRVDRQSLAHYFRAGNVPAPRSILTGIQKLPPAHYLVLKADRAPRLERYWDLNALASARRPPPPPYAEILEQAHGLLRDAVKAQMAADVPLGALLSGGIDSSLVAALMQSQSAAPIKSFSIGFGHADFDEAPYARAVARHLGADHTETYVTDADARAIIPQLPRLYDEPFADSSQIPTYLVAKIARAEVTVALSGDGGDEVFLGYNRYRAWAQMERLPPPVRRMLARLCGKIPAELLNRLGMMLPRALRQPQLGDKIVKFAAFEGEGAADIYTRLASWQMNPEYMVPGALPAPLALPEPIPDDPVAVMQLWDLLGYLPDDVLAKTDRASMAVGLELRVPLLDHRLVEFSLALPRDYLLDKGVTKRLLRDVADRYIPRPLLARGKSGFAVPLAAWLRGPMHDWAEALLAPAMLTEAGLNQPLISRLWREHADRQASHHHQLWMVLMYLAWRQEWGITE